MNDYEKAYLSDTIDILIGYDGETTVEGLKSLIDETRERLIKLHKRQVKREDLGIATNLNNPFEVLEGGKDNVIDKLEYEEQRKKSSDTLDKILKSMEESEDK